MAKKLAAYLSDDAVTLSKSAIHGRGIFAQVNLPGRRKVGEITGKLVKLPEGRRAVENLAVIYFVELTHRVAMDCSDDKNKFKHINHSCRPNCYLRIVGKRVEVYTLRKIRAGTEMTCDYSLTPHKNGMVCRCGQAECKGKL